MNIATKTPLVFAWAGFVFLYINFLVGVGLSQLGSLNFILSIIVSFLLYGFGMYPVVFLSVKHKMNLADAVERYFSKYALFFYMFVVLVNVGWYSIQLEMIWEMFHSFVLLIFFSYLFAYGSFKWGFKYLKIFSFFSINLFLLYVLTALYNTSGNIYIDNQPLDIFLVASSSLIIFGSWAFSSTTLIMDVAKFGKSFKSSYIQLLAGLFLGNILLIILGYIYAKYYNINNFQDFISIFGMFIGEFILILNIWSTNDSNFYNSMNILKKLKIDEKITFFVLPLVSFCLVSLFRDNLFGIIGNWLLLMGNVGLVMILVWWYIFVREKNDRFNTKG